MLKFSFSTVLMTVLTSNLLIILISIFFNSKRILLSIGYRLMNVFLILTLIRFLLPFEFSFTRNIVLPQKLSVLVTHIRHPFVSIAGFQLSIWSFFLWIWICGFLIALGKLLYSSHIFNRYVRRYGSDVTSEESFVINLKAICDSRNLSIRIIKLPGLTVPCQGGLFRPVLLIPAEMNPSEEDLRYILAHELFHYFHKDTWIKLGMNLLSAIYWWNPAAHILRHKVDVILEMRVDRKLILGDSYVREGYVNALVHVAEYAIQAGEAISNSICPTFISMSTGGLADLQQRTHMIYGQRKHSFGLWISLLLLICSLYTASYCFIFEAHTLLPEYEFGLQELSMVDMYAILQDDGTYDLYWNNEFIESVDSLEYYDNIEIIK